MADDFVQRAAESHGHDPYIAKSCSANYVVVVCFGDFESLLAPEVLAVDNFVPGKSQILPYKKYGKCLKYHTFCITLYLYAILLKSIVCEN